MYIDLIVLIVLTILVVIFYNRKQFFIFYIAIVDIFLRLITYIGNNIKIDEISNFINKYLPSSIPNIINKYSSGIINTIITWIYVIIMCIFLYYIVKIFIKKKRV